MTSLLVPKFIYKIGSGGRKCIDEAGDPVIFREDSPVGLEFPKVLLETMQLRDKRFVIFYFKFVERGHVESIDISII